MSFKSILKKWFGKDTPPAHQPYIPQPPLGEVPINQFIQNDGDFSEAKVSADKFYGFQTTFGSVESVNIAGNNAADISQRSSYIVGTGKPVSRIEDVGGICPPCNAQAIELYKAGLISLQDMELRSMYDRESSACCDSCAMQGCNRHIRPVQLPDGQTMQLCVNCQAALNLQMKKARRRQFIKNCFAFFFSPLIERDE